MKRNYLFWSVLAAFVMLSLPPIATAQEQDVNWEAFSANLVKGIKTGNEGIKRSCLQLIIKHAGKVDVSDAGKEIVYIFRFHKNPKVRQLAMNALHKMNYRYGLYIIKRNMLTETDPQILKQSCCIVRKAFAPDELSKEEAEFLASR